MKIRFAVIAVVVFALVTVVAWVYLAHQSRQAATPQPAASAGTYVALGDSVAAGVGLATYSDASACDRTQESYPHLVARHYNLELTSLACSGATVGAGVSGSQTVNKLALKPQLDQLFALPKPKLISLTIGANDMGWTGLISKCVSSTCGTAEDTAVVTARLTGLASQLRQALASINTHYNAAPPRVVLTGYHQLVPAGATACQTLTGLEPAERTWIRQQQTRLNDTIRAAAASASFAAYAPVNFDGHELCTSDSWVQDLQAKAPFHPTAAGQPAFAEAVQTAAGEVK